MKIDFNSIPETAMDGFYGGEKRLCAHMYKGERIKLLCGRLEPGASIGLHTHETSSEIIFILSGTGKAICDGVTETVGQGVCHYCPKGSAHTLINDGAQDLVFYAAVPEL